MKCKGLNITIPKGYWHEDTKLMSSVRAFAMVPRAELGMRVNTSNKKALSDSYRVNIKITKIRWWEDTYDIEVLFMNRYFKHDVKKAPITILENGFNVYKSSSDDSPIYYSPTSQSPNAFIKCHALHFKSKIQPYKNSCVVNSNINGLLNIRYRIYREEIPNIRNINKSISEYLEGWYKKKS